VVIAAAAGICRAMPAGAEEVGVGVGPVGVTVGSNHDERDRDREKTVINIKTATAINDRLLLIVTEPSHLAASIQAGRHCSNLNLKIEPTRLAR
jgi:hypothetical protein